jgi:hypothetical protein
LYAVKAYRGFESLRLRQFFGRGSMKNIERFNLYTAHIFVMLYTSFPVARRVYFPEVFNAVKASLELEPKEEEEQSKFFANTMMWLEETGYIRSRGAGQDRKIVLTPRAFEAMAAPLPTSLRQKDEEKELLSVGEKLIDVAGGFGTELAKETRKQVASQLVGQVIGYAGRSFFGV